MSTKDSIINFRKDIEKTLVSLQIKYDKIKSDIVSEDSINDYIELVNSLVFVESEIRNIRQQLNVKVSQAQYKWMIEDRKPNRGVESIESF